MKWPPTDVQILEEIFHRYYKVFADYSKDDSKRETKNYVPINIEAIAKHFKVDNDLIFGRLYYHLEPKYGFKWDDGTKVPFFARNLGGEKHSIQFPLLATVLADLREQKQKHLISTWLSVVALIISAISVCIALMK